MSLVCVSEEVHPARACFEQMQEYQHPVLLNKMQSELSISRVESEVLFDDVRKFLALCATTKHPLAPARSLDQGWHLFILFTKDYAQFCKAYCGRYIHHEPEDPFAEKKDYEAVPQTRLLAKAVFGEVSSNWTSCLGDCKDCCPESCQGKDCSQNDCTSCKTKIIGPVQ